VASWICVRAEFESEPTDWSLVHDVFAQHGCGGTVESVDPPGLSAYVYEGADAETNIALLCDALIGVGAISVSLESVEEEDWSESWKQFFKAKELGKGFIVAPSWEEPPKSKHRTVIQLDPGQAFGTGDHPTTRLCIELLEEEVGPGATVCDVGTGTGILAIVARKLGAEEVYATEIEEAAFESALRNFERNEVEAAIWNTSMIPEEVPECDVVVSNLVAAILIKMATQMSEIVGEDGVWIFSGVIPDNLPDVQKAGEIAGFELHSWKVEEGWVAGRFIKHRVT
jgi:ribosomal protein L11 methyltransferase